MSAVLKPDRPVLEVEFSISVAGRRIPMAIEVYGRWERASFFGPRGNFDLHRLECHGEDVTKWLQDEELNEAIYDAVYGR